MRAVPVASRLDAVGDREVDAERAGRLAPRSRSVRRAADHGRGRRGVVEHADGVERQRPRRAGHVRRDIHGQRRRRRVSTTANDCAAQLAARGDTRTTSGFVVVMPAVSATVTTSSIELLAAFAVVAVLVDDVAAGGRGDAADAGRVLDRQEQQRVALGVDPAGEHGNGDRAAARDLGRRPLDEAALDAAPLRGGVARHRRRR